MGKSRNLSWVAHQQQINLWVCHGIFLRVINDLIRLELLTHSQGNIKKGTVYWLSEHFTLDITLNRCQRVQWKHHLFQLPNDKDALFRVNWKAHLPTNLSPTTYQVSWTFCITIFPRIAKGRYGHFTHLRDCITEKVMYLSSVLPLYSLIIFIMLYHDCLYSDSQIGS